MKKIIASVFFAAIGIATPLTAVAWTFHTTCPDDSSHSRETVSPEYFTDEDGNFMDQDAESWYMEFSDMICNGEA